jgi:uncharacterized membrane protein
MKTPLRIAGHPLHATLVRFPYALWIFSFVADVVYYFGGYNYDWARAAYCALMVGLVAGVMAAVPGVIDSLAIKEKKAGRLAAWHARINAFAWFSFAGSFYLRTERGGQLVDKNLTIPLLLSFLGTMLVIVSGWYGSEMIYKHRVGVAPKQD